MGGRGASSVSRLSGGGRLDPSSIVSTTSFISERGKLQEEVDQVLEVFRDFENMYGYDVYDIQIAKLKGADAMGALAYYDGANIAFNQNFVNADKMEKVYADTVQSGFHPNNGNKTGLQAVTAHEIGHALVGEIAIKQGKSAMGSIDEVSTMIVNQARKATGHKGVVQMASKISRYATVSNAEAVAEAFADWYSNGSKAQKESIAIVNVVNQLWKS